MPGNRTKQPDRSAELLDFPTRSETIAKLLSDTKDTMPEPAAESSTIPPPELRKTFKVAPQSDLLSRLHSFLPEIESANRQLNELVSQDPKKVDIENVEEDGQYIEMNLGLGVFEEKKPADSDDESDVSVSDIIVNPFAAGKPETKPGITMLDKDEEADDGTDEDSSDNQSSDVEENSH
ncbi:hypothetical protein INT43_006673 [Umbelopsis isabellina]|uniref:Uncharacterized protein n=1 Tax=Mortierella isabellina TaxID=91625 RepID=A0A8H7UHV9_MORIS|nr:hypothetical protein INT43_006673 [Umbelopsis isabellina]